METPIKVFEVDDVTNGNDFLRLKYFFPVPWRWVKKLRNKITETVRQITQINVKQNLKERKKERKTSSFEKRN